MGFAAHLEVVLLVLGLVAAYGYAVRRIGPQVVAEGPPVTRGQVAWFTAGIVTLYVSSAWPMHDVAERYLYSVHMVQHTLLALVIPAMFLRATPEWLGRLILGAPGDRAYDAVRWLARPVAAAIVFNAVQLVTHWPELVNASVSNGLLHYGLHTLAVLTALVMWIPVCGPFPEMRISLPAQMVYLFTMSIAPTVPAGWLTFAEGAVYSSYDVPERLFGVSVTHDQQWAGLVMKLGAGMFLWGLIAVLFFRWAARDMAPGPRPREMPDGGAAAETQTPGDAPLTYEQVTRAFDRVDVPPTETPTG